MPKLWPPEARAFAPGRLSRAVVSRGAGQGRAVATKTAVWRGTAAASRSGMVLRIATWVLLAASFTLAPVATPVVQAFDSEFIFTPIDKDTMGVSFKAWSGEIVQLCVKPDGAGGNVCSGNNSVVTSWLTVTHANTMWDKNTSRMMVHVDVPKCGKYKVRLKRSALAFDTSHFSMPC